MHSDYYIDHLRINLHNSLSLHCTGNSTPIHIHPSIYGIKAPSGPWPPSEDASILLCLLFVSSILLFLESPVTSNPKILYHRQV